MAKTRTRAVSATFIIAAILSFFLPMEATAGCVKEQGAQWRIGAVPGGISRAVARKEKNDHALRGTGYASWYGGRFHGRRTASGETFDKHKFTAAHPSLPFGTKARVTNLKNNHSVVVHINDRGPFAKGRIMDLSLAAARRIGIIGIAPVRIEVLLPAR